MGFALLNKVWSGRERGIRKRILFKKGNDGQEPSISATDFITFLLVSLWALWRGGEKKNKKGKRRKCT